MPELHFECRAEHGLHGSQGWHFEVLLHEFRFALKLLCLLRLRWALDAAGLLPAERLSLLGRVFQSAAVVSLTLRARLQVASLLLRSA